MPGNASGEQAQLTTPLHPDDYLRLLNPLWSARELRGRVEKVVPETDDAATLVIRPGWGWRYDHRPGQYVGIGVQVDGKFQWRSYSVSSPPRRGGRTIAITVRAMPEGLLSAHLVTASSPARSSGWRCPRATSCCPTRRRRRMLFLVGGSGITPVMAMLRTLDRRGTMPDVVMHYSSPTAERMIFRDELRRRSRSGTTADPAPAAHRHRRHARARRPRRPVPRLARARDLGLRARRRCSTPIEEHWEQAGLEDRLHLERFSLELGGDGGEGGTITFRTSGKTAEVDGATTLLEAGEEAGVGMPYGCRMGICHTCTLTLVSGTVRDLRNGDEFAQPNEQVQTCVTAAVGDCTLDI